MTFLHQQDINSKKIKMVVFDLDGTVADTSEGILNSHRYAHTVMGRTVPADEILYSVIGAPLLDTYRNVFHFSDEQATEAVRIYRSWYADQGIKQAMLYPGMVNILQTLKRHGISAGIATLKAERFAESMMTDLGVRDYFCCIFGMNDGDTSTKSELISKCMLYTGAGAEETVMIGDSIHDFNGAQLCGVPFIGVSYGFGFRKGEEHSFIVCDNLHEITEYLI